MGNVYPGVLLVSVSQLIRAACLAVRRVQGERALSSEQHVSCTSWDCVLLPWGVLFRLKVELPAAICSGYAADHWGFSSGSLGFCLPVSCLFYPWMPLHDIQATPVTELTCFALLLSAYRDGENGESLWAGVAWCTNVLAATETGTKLAFLSVLLFLQRPGMPSGARMPHQGAPMGPPGPPYVGSPSVRPGMPQTVMETRKRTAPQQVQQQQVQQQVQQQQQATQNRARRWVFWKENTGGQFEEAKMIPV